MQSGSMNQEIMRVQQMAVKHLHGEEKAFYPRLRDTMSDLVQEAMKEHEEIRTHMQQAMSSTSDQSRMMDHLRKLKQAVQHHVDEEENKVFPKVRQTFDTRQLEEMARNFEDAKQQAPGMGAAMPGRAEASR